MDLVGNDVDTLYGEIEYLVGHLVGNDMDTLHEERIHLVGFNFIRVIDFSCCIFVDHDITFGSHCHTSVLD